MRQYNNLTVEVYESGTTRIADPLGELRLAEGIGFSTLYPGGLYGEASFYVSRRAAAWWAVRGGRRLVLRNGQKIVWEGAIENLEQALDEGGQGVLVKAVGYWGRLLMRRRWRKPWADDRVDDSVWTWKPGTTNDADEMFSVDREGPRIHIYPKNATFASGDYGAVEYTAPDGETIKRIAYNYDFAEVSGAWEMVVSAWDGASWTDAATTSITATGTGAIDYTFVTPRSKIQLRMYARGANTPTYQDHNHAEWSSLVVYTETGSINLTEVAKDVRAKLTELNSSEALIGSNTYSLVPFVAEGYETMADILMEAAGYGDGSGNQWAVGLRDSEQVTTPDGKPVLFAEQFAALTTAEFRVRLDDENLVGQLGLVQDFGELWNYVVVEYTDANGRQQWLTPTTDATLQDATSIADYGQREIVYQIGQASAATAQDAGQRFLGAYKSPIWRVTGPLQVAGFIRTMSHHVTPASHIRAGLRVKVENWIDQDLIFRIAATDYDDDSEVCRLSFGGPDELLLPRWLPARYVPGSGDEKREPGGGTDPQKRKLSKKQKKKRAWERDPRKTPKFW